VSGAGDSGAGRAIAAPVWRPRGRAQRGADRRGVAPWLAARLAVRFAQPLQRRHLLRPEQRAPFLRAWRCKLVPPAPPSAPPSGASSEGPRGPSAGRSLGWGDRGSGTGGPLAGRAALERTERQKELPHDLLPPAQLPPCRLPPHPRALRPIGLCARARRSSASYLTTSRRGRSPPPCCGKPLSGRRVSRGLDHLDERDAEAARRSHLHAPLPSAAGGRGRCTLHEARETGAAGGQRRARLSSVPSPPVQEIKDEHGAIVGGRSRPRRGWEATTCNEKSCSHSMERLCP